MKSYSLKFFPRVERDIITIRDYYDKEQKGLGARFYYEFKQTVRSLKINPFYQIRYDTIRCLPIKGFPFMIHFEVNEEKAEVYIYAVISTYQNPDTAWIK